MSDRNAYIEREIKRKCKIAREYAPDETHYEEMAEQIEICEELCRPLSETQIEEWVQLSVVQMCNKILDHKLDREETPRSIPVVIKHINKKAC